MKYIEILAFSHLLQIINNFRLYSTPLSLIVYYQFIFNIFYEGNFNRLSELRLNIHLRITIKYSNYLTNHFRKS